MTFDRMYLLRNIGLSKFETCVNVVEQIWVEGAGLQFTTICNENGSIHFIGYTRSPQNAPRLKFDDAVALFAGVKPISPSEFMAKHPTPPIAKIDFSLR